MTTHIAFSKILKITALVFSGYAIHAAAPAIASYANAPAAIYQAAPRNSAAHEQFLRSVEKQYAGKVDPKVIRAANEIMLTMADEKNRTLAARAPRQHGVEKLLGQLVKMPSNSAVAASNSDAPLWLASTLTPGS